MKSCAAVGIGSSNLALDHVHKQINYMMHVQ